MTRPDYGIDAPGMVRGLLIGGGVLPGITLSAKKRIVAQVVPYARLP